MKKKRLLIVARNIFWCFLIFVGVIGVGFAWFAMETFSLPRTERQTDAIVVLTGGRGRVEEGLHLYRTGHARLLLLAGVDPAVRRSDLFNERPEEMLTSGILLEKNSRNTLENALYTRDLLASRHVRTIQLITSRYHMQRAHLLFRKVLPKEITIYPYPVESKNLTAVWWRQPVGVRLLFTEFYKYWLFRALFAFTGELTTNSAE